MKKTLLFCLIIAANTFGQSRIKGTIVDIKTDEVLPFANVYISNTTKGTQTDTDGNFTLNNIIPGKVQLVVSYVGYETFQQTIALDDGKEITLRIRLTVAANALSEVQIKAKKRDKEWERYLRDFRNQFLGDSPNTLQCKVLNEWAIEFDETESDHTIHAKANRPIEIENRALGYKLFYDLRQYSLSKTTFRLSGTTRFENLKPSSDKEAQKWEKRREETYLASTRNFFKSLINGHLEPNGFVIYQTNSKADWTSNATDFRKGSNMITDENNSKLLAISPKANESLLFLEVPIEVTNNKRYVAINNVSSNPVSMIRQLKPKVEIANDGWLYDPTAIEFQGYWANERVAEMLPREYGQDVSMQPAAAKDVPQVYLQLNKSGFTAGEKIWFSAYLTNRETKALLPDQQPLYVQLYTAEGVKIAEEKIFTSNGRGYGNILIPLKQLSGVFRFRAFTKQMLNAPESIFEKELIVQNVQEKIQVVRKSKLLTEVADNPLKISILSPVEALNPRQKIDLKIKVTAANNKPVQGTFSMAVTDAKAGVQNVDDFDILAYSAQKKAIKIENNNYKIEKTMLLSGLAQLQKSKKPIANGQVILMVVDSTSKTSSRVVDTDAFGRFKIDDWELQGDKSITYQVNNKKGRAEFDGEIVFDDVNPNEKLPIINYEKIALPEEKRMELLMNIQKPDGDEFVVSLGDILLEEVLVLDKKQEKDPNEVGIFKPYSEPTHSFSFDETAPKFTDVYDMMAGTLPGVTVSSDANGQKGVRIRGIGTINSSSPLFVVDGTAVDEISFVNPNDVARIDVISDGMAGGMYGMRAANGVILIYTRRFRTKFNNLVFAKNMLMRGLQADVPFYSPNYSVPKADHKEIDRRTTIYWNPEIITDENGEATVSFYTADRATNYKIVVEGVTQGNAGHSEATLKVK